MLLLSDGFHPVSYRVPASGGAPTSTKPAPPFKCVCLPEPARGVKPVPPFQAFANCLNRPTVTSYLSRRKVLTVAGSSSPVAPPSGAIQKSSATSGSVSYVRQKAPPVTS